MKGKIAVIGAGITGLTLAQLLQGKFDVLLYEKSWRPGGRMSTRHSDEFQFDHGTQYFTIRGTEFRNFLNEAFLDGIIRPWEARFMAFDGGSPLKYEERQEVVYVGTPSMNSLCRYLARDLDIKCDTDVQNCRYDAEGWFLSIENEIEEGPFDLLISTIPAPQNDDLFAKNITLWEGLAGVQMRGCSTLMLGFKNPVDIAWEGAIVRNSPIGWIGLDSSKPARPGNTSLVVQSTGDWGDKLLNAETSQIENVLLEELKKISGIDGWLASHRSIHRWRYAGTSKVAGQKYFLDPGSKLAFCGDWCIKGRVEAAFMSAEALAKALLQ